MPRVPIALLSAAENRALCFDQAAFKVGACFSIHRQGAALAAKNISDPRRYCGEGPVSVE